MKLLKRLLPVILVVLLVFACTNLVSAEPGSPIVPAPSPSPIPAPTPTPVQVQPDPSPSPTSPPSTSTPLPTIPGVPQNTDGGTGLILSFDGVNDGVKGVTVKEVVPTAKLPDYFTAMSPAYCISWKGDDDAALLSLPLSGGTQYFAAVYRDGKYELVDIAYADGIATALIRSGDVIQFFKVEAGRRVDGVVPSYINFDFMKYQANKSNGNITGYDGFVPDPVNLYGGGGASGTASISDADMGDPNSAKYPAVYDKRSEAYFPTVKDQQKTNLCWDFSAVSAVELFLGQQQNKRFDLSVSNAAYFLSVKGDAGFNRDIPDAGNFKMNMAYMTRGDGPVNESDDPYANVLAGKTAGKQSSVAYVSGFEQIPYSIDNVKDYIMKYGSVVCSMYAVDDKASAFYNPANAAYYMSDPSVTPNHAIQIVGWDNNFSKDNFATKPPIDGAWIVKNSWGTSSGDNGYYYISFADNTIAKSVSAVTSVDSASEYGSVYLYDPFGETGRVNFNTKTAWFGNVFSRQDGDSSLSAVSFYSSNPDSSYEIWVSATGDLSKKEKVQSGTAAKMGYFTIKLDEPVNLAYSEFAVIIKLTAPNTASIPIEKNVQGYVESASAASGQSFVSTDGEKWKDVTETVSGANVCVRALTAPAAPAEIRISIDGVIVVPVDAVPMIVNDRTFVPLRLIGEHLGYEVTWDNATGTAFVGNKFAHQTGTTFVSMADGTVRDIGVASFLQNNRSMVSIRLFAEALGYQVDYDGASRTVLIKTK